MDLLDVNEHPHRRMFRPCDVEGLAGGGSEPGLLVTFPPLVEVAFLRIVTHPEIFVIPSSFEEAVEFLQVLHESGQFRETPWTLRMRAQWWRWCRDLELHGNDVNDAFLAATAVEARCRLVTRDGGFSRFTGLDWWNPTKPRQPAE